MLPARAGPRRAAFISLGLISFARCKEEQIGHRRQAEMGYDVCHDCRGPRSNDIIPPATGSALSNDASGQDPVLPYATVEK